MKEGKLGSTLKDVLGVEFGQREDGGWKAGEPLRRWDDASFWETDGVTKKDWSGCMGEVVQGLVRERRDDLVSSTTTEVRDFFWVRFDEEVELTRLSFSSWM